MTGHLLWHWGELTGVSAIRWPIAAEARGPLELDEAEGGRPGPNAGSGGGGLWVQGARGTTAVGRLVSNLKILQLDDGAIMIKSA